MVDKLYKIETGETLHSRTIAKTHNRPVKSKQDNAQDNNRTAGSTVRCSLLDSQKMQYADPAGEKKQPLRIKDKRESCILTNDRPHILQLGSLQKGTTPALLNLIYSVDLCTNPAIQAFVN